MHTSLSLAWLKPPTLNHRTPATHPTHPVTHPHCSAMQLLLLMQPQPSQRLPRSDWTADLLMLHSQTFPALAAAKARDRRLS